MKKTTKNGFTIIEFSLAITFIATLLVSISVFTMRVSRIYQKGLTVRSLNMTSREIIDDLDTTVRSSAIPTSKIFDKKASISEAVRQMNENYFYAYKAGNGTSKQEYGAFCTNSYTYVYNTPVVMGSSHGITLSYNGGSKKYKFAKFKDFGCDKYKEIYGLSASGGSVTVNLDSTNPPMEVMGDSEIDLYLYDFTVNPAYQEPVTKHIVYNIGFTLGTAQGDINITATSDYCDAKDPTTLSYCSVNKFNATIIQTGDSQGV